MKTHYTIMAAIAANNVVGINNDLPWAMGEIPRDLPHFARQTKQGVNPGLILGRNTLESFKGKLLKGRYHMVVSTTLTPGWHDEGFHVFPSFEEAVGYASEHFDEVYLLGGPKIWEMGIRFADRAILTRIEKEYEGDTFFPIEGIESLYERVYYDSWNEKEEGKTSSKLEVWLRKG